MSSSQTPSEVLMVRPLSFGFDAETAASNAFQSEAAAKDDTSVRAQAEFDAAVDKLRAKGVRVKVFQDQDDGIKKPDSVKKRRPNAINFLLRPYLWALSLLGLSQ